MICIGQTSLPLAPALPGVARGGLLHPRGEPLCQVNLSGFSQLTVKKGLSATDRQQCETIVTSARACRRQLSSRGRMVKLCDNIKLQSGPDLLKTLRVSQRTDVAVRYFNLHGWSIFYEYVRPHLDGPSATPTTTVRILIGMVAADPQRQALEDFQGQVDGTVLAMLDGEQQGTAEPVPRASIAVIDNGLLNRLTD